METLSDFGAVQHFAIPTFTTGIFRTWLGMYDLTTAMQLASMLLLVVFIILYIEKWQRGNQRYSLSSARSEPNKEVKLYGFQNFMATLFCLLPITIGFILPVQELLSWSLELENNVSTKFVSATFNTLSLATFAGVLTLSLIHI